MKKHSCDPSKSWCEIDAQGIPLFRVCALCRNAKLRNLKKTRPKSPELAPPRPHLAVWYDSIIDDPELGKKAVLAILVLLLLLAAMSYTQRSQTTRERSEASEKVYRELEAKIMKPTEVGEPRRARYYYTEKGEVREWTPRLNNSIGRQKEWRQQLTEGLEAYYGPGWRPTEAEQAKIDAVASRMSQPLPDDD